MSLVGIFMGIGAVFALIILVIYFASKKFPKIRAIMLRIKKIIFFGLIITSV